MRALSRQTQEKGGILTEQEREILKKERSGAGAHGQGRGLHAAVLPVSDDDEAVGASDPFLSGAFGLWEDPAAFQPHRPDEKKRFPAVPVQGAAELKEAAIHRTAAKRAVISWLQDPESMERDRKRPCCTGFCPGRIWKKERMEALAEACSYSYREHGIGREAARALYGTILNGSVTRMEGYAACAYAHFFEPWTGA